MADHEQEVATATTTTAPTPQTPISPQVNNLKPARKLSFDVSKLEKSQSHVYDNIDGECSITRPRKESDVSTLAEVACALSSNTENNVNDVNTQINDSVDNCIDHATGSTNVDFHMKEDVTPRSNVGSTENMFRLETVKILVEKDDTSVATFDNPSSIAQNLVPKSDTSQDHHDIISNQIDLKPLRFGEAVVKTEDDDASALLVLDHLDALGKTDGKRHDDESSSNPLGDAVVQKLDAFMATGGNSSATSSRNRERAESWGGMSDLSHAAAMVEKAYAGSSVTGSNNAGMIGELMMGTTSSTSSHVDIGGLLSPPSRSRSASIASNASAITTKQSGVPVKISVMKGTPTNLNLMRERFDSLSSGSNINNYNRDRIDSLSSASQKRQSRERMDSFASGLESVVNRDRIDSLANLSGLFSRRDRFDSIASLGEVSMNISIADLADIAGNLESVAKDYEDLGSEDGVKVKKDGNMSSSQSKLAASAPTISVDSEAVQAAVQAALSVTSGNILDFLHTNPNSSNPINTENLSAPKLSSITGSISKFNSAQLVNPSSLKSESEMEAIRARARAAAGYVHPNMNGTTTPKLSKKRPLPTCSNFAASKRVASDIASTPNTTYSKAAPGVHIYSEFTTPKAKNSAMKYPYTPPSSARSGGGQSNQKWEEMFECLVVYVQEQKEKDTKDMTEEERGRWEWSGNVPTMYKTPDGKALGRWINNQRSAKSKGTLKVEREIRLVSTGLKWSVLTTNAWADMMAELRVYVAEKTKDGKLWDGNVPTNFKTKNNTAADGSEIDEDKNLGRWINRQRSLFQSGKLKKERREELERIGLKWAVLSTSSWLAMYDSLCLYVEAQKKLSKDGTWDGNVPANQETNDDPPKRLGRWVNRQRSAHANKKLKKEFADKLERLGLKWTAFDAANKKYYPTENYSLMTSSLMTMKSVGVGMNGIPQKVPSSDKGHASTIPKNGQQISYKTFTHMSAVPNTVSSSSALSSAVPSSTTSSSVNLPSTNAAVSTASAIPPLAPSSLLINKQSGNVPVSSGTSIKPPSSKLVASVAKSTGVSIINSSLAVLPSMAASSVIKNLPGRSLPSVTDSALKRSAATVAALPALPSAASVIKRLTEKNVQKPIDTKKVLGKIPLSSLPSSLPLLDSASVTKLAVSTMINRHPGEIITTLPASQPSTKSTTELSVTGLTSSSSGKTMSSSAKNVAVRNGTTESSLLSVAMKQAKINITNKSPSINKMSTPVETQKAVSTPPIQSSVVSTSIASSTITQSSQNKPSPSPSLEISSSRNVTTKSITTNRSSTVKSPPDMNTLTEMTLPSTPRNESVIPAVLPTQQGETPIASIKIATEL